MNNRTVLSYVNGIIKGSAKKRFLVIMLLSVISSLAVVLTPVVISSLTGLLQDEENKNINLIFMLGIAYILMISVQKVISFISVYLQSLLRVQCIGCISEDYLFRLYRKGRFSEMSNSGDMSQRLNQASNDIYVMVSNMALTLFPPVFQLSIAIFLIFTSGDELISLLFFCYAISFVLVNYFFVRKLLIARADFMNSGRNTYRLLVDSVQNIPVVRNFNTFPFFFNRFRKSLSDDISVQNAYWKLDFANLATSSLLQILFFGSAFIYTLYRAIHGEISLAHFILISSYLMIITGPLEHLASSFIGFTQSFTSFKAFIGFLNNQKTTADSGDSPVNFENGTVSLTGVVVGYPDADTAAIGPITVRFREGAFITVTGRSGAGKSTLVKLLMRELRTTEGTYTIGGLDAFSLPDNDFFSSIAYVSQDEYVFMDTVEFNLRIAAPEAPREALLHALDLAEFRLPESDGDEILEKVISNEGANLSGGQRQRLALARLFLRKPRIVILDEVTSSLDVPSEIVLLTRVRSRFPEATILNISHRPSAFKLSDDIIIIDRGLIEAHGTYDEIKGINPYLLEILANESGEH